MRIIVALSALVVLSCSSKPGDSAAVGGTSPGSGAPAGAPGKLAAGVPAGVKAAHLAALDRAPPGTALLMTADVGAYLNAIVGSRLGLLPPTGDAAAFRKALGDASRRDFGVDLLAIRTVSAWLSPAEKAFAVIAEGPFDGVLTCTGVETVEIEGFKALKLDRTVFAALVDGRLVVGTPSAFALLKASPSAEAGVRAQHKQALEAVADGPIVVTAAVVPMLEAALPMRGLQAAAASLGSDFVLHAAAVGEPASMDSVKALVDSIRAPMIAELDTAVNEVARQTFPGAAMASVFVAASAADLKAFEWVTRASPNVLTASSPALNMATAATLTVPTLAAIAVPAFIKYMRRAKTVEALDGLDRIYKGSAAYYATPMVEKGTGQKLPCAFPPSVGPTPPLEVSCCDGTRGTDGRCKAVAADWDAPTWQALGFQLSDPHYFRYAYSSGGTGASAKFTVSAYADLDCDGVFSTFERYGFGDPSPDGSECSMKGSSAFFKDRETE